MALGTQVVNLVRLNLADQAHQIGAVGEVSVMKDEPGIGFVWILIKVINAGGVEIAGSSLNSMHHISFIK